MKRNGFALIVVVFLVMLVLILGTALTRQIFSGYFTAKSAENSLKAIYLAEAGAEIGKSKISNQPNFYTDLPHPAKDDLEWLFNDAVGYRMDTEVGQIKLVREKDKNYLYGIGLSAQSRAIVKIEFTFPFKQISWEMI